MDQTKKIEEECFKYLSHIREILATASIILLPHAGKNGQMTSPAVSYQKRRMERCKTNTEEYFLLLMEEVTKCCHARRRIKEQSQPDQKTSHLAKDPWLDRNELDFWKNIFKEIIGNLRRWCDGRQGQIGKITKSFLKCIEKNHKKQLEQLEAATQCTDRDPRESVIGLLSGLAGSCELLYGMHAFMKSYVPSETEQQTDELFQILILRKRIEGVYQRVTLSCRLPTSTEFDLDEQKEALNKWVKEFPQIEMGYRKLLKSWQDFFSPFCDQTSFYDSWISEVQNYTAFQARRMTEEIGQHLKYLQRRMRKGIFKKFDGYSVLETIEEGEIYHKEIV